MLEDQILSKLLQQHGTIGTSFRDVTMEQPGAAIIPYVVPQRVDLAFGLDVMTVTELANVRKLVRITRTKLRMKLYIPIGSPFCFLLYIVNLRPWEDNLARGAEEIRQYLVCVVCLCARASNIATVPSVLGINYMMNKYFPMCVTRFCIQ